MSGAVSAQSLALKRRQLQSVFQESLFNEGDDKVVSELLEYEEMVKCFAILIEIKYGVRIRCEPRCEIEGEPRGVQKHDEKWIEEINELVKNVDFKNVFKQKYEVSLMETRVLLKETLQETLQRKLRERRSSVASIDSDSGSPLKDSAAAPRPSPGVDATSSNIKGKTLHVNRKITSNLLRTNQILRTSVLQSELNIDELKQQTDTLMLLNDKFDSFKAMSQASAKLIKAINNSSYQEKQKVYLALAFFSCCITWVLWRRIFKYPVRLLFWLCFRAFKSLLYFLGLVAPTSTLAAPHSLAPVSESTTAGSRDLQRAVSDSFDKILDEL